MYKKGNKLHKQECSGYFTLFVYMENVIITAHDTTGKTSWKLQQTTFLIFKSMSGYINKRSNKFENIT